MRHADGMRHACHACTDHIGDVKTTVRAIITCRRRTTWTHGVWNLRRRCERSTASSAGVQSMPHLISSRADQHLTTSLVQPASIYGCLRCAAQDCDPKYMQACVSQLGKMFWGICDTCAHAKPAISAADELTFRTPAAGWRSRTGTSRRSCGQRALRTTSRMQRRALGFFAMHYMPQHCILPTAGTASAGTASGICAWSPFCRCAS